MDAEAARVVVMSTVERTVDSYRKYQKGMKAIRIEAIAPLPQD